MPSENLASETVDHMLLLPGLQEPSQTRDLYFAYFISPRKLSACQLGTLAPSLTNIAWELLLSSFGAAVKVLV